MPSSYVHWNDALITHFTEGLPFGASVYLSVDEDVLQKLGPRLNIAAPHAVNAFCAAVRAYCCPHDVLQLENLASSGPDGRPQGVAFLGAMVLAAYRMGEDDDISERNYFRRWREVLRLPEEEGRPPGMRLGDQAEEPLWHAWARWLHRSGWLATARRGLASRTYLNYPISQSLLRASDKQRLARFWAEKKYPADLDLISFGNLLLRDRAEIGWKHLREILKDNFQGASEACYEVYQQLASAAFAHPADGTPTLRYPRSDRLLAGLYRTADPFSGQIDYWLYPRQAQRTESSAGTCSINSILKPLKSERPGWYEPVAALAPIDFGQRLAFPVNGHPTAKQLIFPKRDFWLLVPDEEGSEALADWSRPAPGTYFYLLCQRDLAAQMELLRDERLIAWEDVRPVADNPDWLEYAQVLVQSPSWEGVTIPHAELYHALRPVVRLGLSLEGGLRGGGGWLCTHPPRIVVHGFHPKAQVTLRQALTDNLCWEGEAETNQPLNKLPPLAAGQYLLTAEYGLDSVRRLFRITDWQNLELAERQVSYSVACGAWRINGASLQKG